MKKQNNSWRNFAIFLILSLVYVTVPPFKGIVNYGLTEPLTYAIIFGIAFGFCRIWVWDLSSSLKHEKRERKMYNRQRDEFIAKWVSEMGQKEKLVIKLLKAYQTIRGLGLIIRVQRRDGRRLIKNHARELKQYIKNNNALRKEALDNLKRAEVAEGRLSCFDSFVEDVNELFKEEIGNPNAERKYFALRERTLNTVSLYKPASIPFTINVKNESALKPVPLFTSPLASHEELLNTCEVENRDLRKLVTDIIQSLTARINATSIDDNIDRNLMLELLEKVKQRYEKIKYFNS